MVIEWSKVAGNGIKWEEISMLVGTYEHKMDTKGRIVLPSRFREELGDGAIATIGIDRCVAVYSAEDWENILERLQRLPFSKGKTRDFTRLLLAMAHEVQIDSSGRALIPPHLRNHGDLSQEVSIVGVGDHIELWNKNTWSSYVEEVRNELPEIAEEVEGL